MSLQKRAFVKSADSWVPSSATGLRSAADAGRHSTACTVGLSHSGSFSIAAALAALGAGTVADAAADGGVAADGIVGDEQDPITSTSAANAATRDDWLRITSPPKKARSVRPFFSAVSSRLRLIRRAVCA